MPRQAPMRVFLTSPWIPAEWIRAHGFEARGIWFAETFRRLTPPLAAGVCAFAECAVRFAESQPDAAVVFTTACDQLRRGYDDATFRGPARAFLFNLPATQTPVARQLYRAELERLGQFLLELGGAAPTPEILRRELGQSDAARRRLREAAPAAAARSYAESAARYHDHGVFSAPLEFGRSHKSRNPKSEIRTRGPAGDSTLADPDSREPDSGIRISDLEPALLALVGGPLCATDWNLFDTIAAAGGRVVLNATQTGERGLSPDLARSAGSPPAWAATSAMASGEFGFAKPLASGLSGPRQAAALENHPDPLDALVAGYFENIVDVFQRPNTRLYSWLKPRLLARRARGIVLWHFTGCDLWRAELQTLREVSGLPVLLLEADEAAGISPREANRLQAFVEMLKSK